jgi:hypothetical protein
MLARDVKDTKHSADDESFFHVKGYEYPALYRHPSHYILAKSENPVSARLNK